MSTFPVVPVQRVVLLGFVTLFLGATQIVKGFSISMPTQTLSRRDFVRASLLSSGVASTFLIKPTVAHPDIATELASNAALRNVKRASKQLDGMETFATAVDYQGMKDAIRTAPLAEIRKNAYALVRGAGEDGPVLEGYRTFIAALEALDTTCNLALRGRDLPDTQLAEKFDSTSVALTDFIKLAEASVADVPETDEPTAST